MRTFIGMVLGCLLTVAAVYIHDSMAPAVADGKAASSDMIVNWDVATRKWVSIRETAHTAWIKLQSAANAKGA